MLKLMQSGRKWTISELSDKLDVSPRMVRYYKSNLEEAGIQFKIVKGSQGGYILEEGSQKIDVSVTEEDMLEIERLNENGQINNLIDKLRCNYYEVQNQYYTIINATNHKYGKKADDFISSILNKKKIKLTYCGSSEKVTIRVVMPIDIFVYDKDIYLLAFCELRNSIRAFPLQSIKGYSIE